MQLNRRTALKTGVAIGVTAISGCLGGGDGDGTNLTLGTSGEETSAHAVGTAFGSVVSNNSDQLNVSSQTTNGSMANNRLLDEGDIDLAQGSSLSMWYGNTDQPPFEEEPIGITLAQIVPSRTTDNFLIKRDVDNLSDVTDVTDIPRDTPMSWGPPQASGFSMIKIGLRAAGIEDPEEHFTNIQPIEFGDQPDAMNEGRIDIAFGAFINQTTPLGWMEEMASRLEIDVLNWGFSQSDLEAMGAPSNISEVNAEETMLGDQVSNDVIELSSFPYFTIASEELSEDDAYEFTNVLLNNYEATQDYHAFLENWGPEFVENAILTGNDDLPIHPGAQNAFEDHELL